MPRCDVLSPNLDDTGTSGFGSCEQNTEIQVMSKHNSLILAPIKGLVIRSGGTAYFRPM